VTFVLEWRKNGFTTVSDEVSIVIVTLRNLPCEVPLVVGGKMYSVVVLPPKSISPPTNVLVPQTTTVRFPISDIITNLVTVTRP